MKRLLCCILAVIIALGSVSLTFAVDTDSYLMNYTFDKNTDGWNNAQGYISRAVDPLNSDNYACVFSGKGESSNKYINARAYFDDAKTDDKIFTGKVLITNKGDVSFDYRLRGAANEALISFDKGGNIKVRDSATGLTWVPNKWITFSVYVKYSNSVNTTCPVYATLSSDEGMVDADNKVVKTYYDNSKTLDVSKYESNFGATGNSRNSINAQSVFYTNSTAKIYMDNAKIFIPAAPVAVKENAKEKVEYIDTLDVSFNHQVDMTTVKADNFVLKNQGASYKPVSVVPDYTDADSVQLKFEPIDISGEYSLDMSAVKDISGTSVSNSLIYTVENIAAEPITALSLSYSGNLTQTYGNTSPIEFTANTTPTTGVRTSSISWYVNEVKQDVVGTNFSLNPDSVNTYKVYATVADSDVKSDVVTATVEKADPAVTWPTVSVIYEGYTVGDALNDDGVGDGVFTIEDADEKPAANSDGYTKKIIFTPTDTVNYNVIYKDVTVVVNEATDMAYDSVVVTNDSKPFVKLADVKTVTYTANAIPEIGPNADSLIWYVNGAKQDVTGKTFSFKPAKAGSYYVSVAVSNNASANVTGSSLAVLPNDAITSNNTYYINGEDFTKGNLNQFTNISGKEPGSGVKVSTDPFDSNNKVADYYAASTGSTFIGMRKVMDAANPLVISSKIMLYGEPEDNGNYSGRSFSILFRSMVDGYGSHTVLAFNHDNSITMGGKRVGTWLNNKWIDFTICLVPNGADPSQCNLVGIFEGAIDNKGNDTVFTETVVVDYSNFAFDNPQIQFNSVIKANKDGRNHVYLDDFSGYSIDKFEPILLEKTNVGAVNSLLVMYNHDVDLNTANIANIKVYDNNNNPVEIKSVSTSLLSPNYTCLNFKENLKANTTYRIDFSEKLNDIAKMSPCYKSIYFSTGSQTPPDSETAEIKVNRISVYPEYFELPLGFALPCELAVTVTPDSATNPTLRWVSSNEDVATVTNGIVTGVSLGETEIQAFATDGSGISSNKIKVKITESRVAGENQQINLGAGNNRIDTEKHLSMPANIGEGQVALWNDNKTGAITITVDDCITGDFAQWMKWTEEYGFQFTFFVPTKEYGTNSWPKEALEQLIAAGEDVQSHSYHHYDDDTINGLSTAQSILEFKQPLEAINSLEGGSAKAIAYSYGTGDKNYAAQFYIACRGVVTLRLNQAASTDYTYISSISMDGSQNITEDNDGQVSLESAIKSLYDKNAKYRNTSYYGGWTSFHTHGLGKIRDGEIIPDQGGLSTAESYKYIFDNYMYPAKDKLWVGKFSEVAMYAQERDTATLNMLSSDSNQITYNLTDKMDDFLFDYPLTVKVKVDPSWENITAVQNGEEIELTEVIDGTDKYVFVKSVPDRGIVTLTHDGSAEKDYSIISGIKCNIVGNTVTLTSDSDVDLHIFVATYSGDVMETVSTTECPLDKGVPMEKTVSIPSSQTGKKTKLIILSSTMQPVIIPIEY